jgi:hypothetical protein
MLTTILTMSLVTSNLLFYLRAGACAMRMLYDKTNLFPLLLTRLLLLSTGGKSP